MDIKIANVIDANNPTVGDLFLENGTIRLTNTLTEEVIQTLRIGLLLFQGEWFLDPDQGMPYFQTILGQKTPLGIISQIFRSAILQVPGVKQLTSFEAKTLPNRGLQVVFALLLQDGTIIKSSDFAPFIVGP
jgi:hypothetical protein